MDPVLKRGIWIQLCGSFGPQGRVEPRSLFAKQLGSDREVSKAARSESFRKSGALI